MTPLITLIKREWWEFRKIFFYIPLFLCILLVIAGLIGLSLLAGFDITISDLPEKWQASLHGDAISFLLYRVSFVFMAMQWLIVLGYFLSCLHKDRREGNVLFWQSMPVSQTQNLIAKLLTGLIVVPLAIWLWMLLTEFLLLIFYAVAIEFLDFNVMQTLWHPDVIFSIWLNILVMLGIQGLWMFPVVGWFLFCSAIAKRSPLFIALLVPLAVIAWQEIFSTQHSVFRWISERFTDAAFAAPLHGHAEPLLYGILAGVLLVMLAGLRRGRC